MIISDPILQHGLTVALVILILALIVTCIRVIIGPTLADRTLALDQLVAIAIGLIALQAVKTGYELYIDIALALGLVGFLATVALARYLSIAKPSAEDDSDPDNNEPEPR